MKHFKDMRNFPLNHNNYRFDHTSDRHSPIYDPEDHDWNWFEIMTCVAAFALVVACAFT